MRVCCLKKWELRAGRGNFKVNSRWGEEVELYCLDCVVWLEYSSIFFLIIPDLRMFINLKLGHACIRFVFFLSFAESLNRMGRPQWKCTGLGAILNEMLVVTLRLKMDEYVFLWDCESPCSQVSLLNSLLPCFSCRHLGGTVPQLGLHLFWLIWELKLVTGSRWKKKAVIGEKHHRTIQLKASTSHVSIIPLLQTSILLLLSAMLETTAFSWNCVIYCWISCMVEMLLQPLSLSKMINCEFPTLKLSHGSISIF